MNPPLNVHLIIDAAGLHEVASFLSSVSEFNLDIETNVVDTFYERRIRTIQVGSRTHQYVIDLLAFAGSTEALVNGLGGYSPQLWAKPVVDCLRPFLESSKYLKIGCGLDFEYETLKWNLGLRIFCLYDTLLAEKVIYSGIVPFHQKDFWGLKHQVGRYCGLLVDKQEQTGFNLTEPLTESQVTYAGLDARLPSAVKAGQSIQILKAGLAKAVQIENDAIPSNTDLHLNGLYIDAAKWNGLVDKTREDQKKNIVALDALFIPVVGRAEQPYTQEYLDTIEKEWRACKEREERGVLLTKFRAAKSQNTAYNKKAKKYEGEAAISYGSPDQMLKALVKAGYSIKNTNDDTLERLEGEPIIDAVREFRTAQKVIDGYGKFLDKYVDKNTGRVHSNFSQLGAETGRMTSASPNVQNINRESDWRECFVAREGYVIITVDYNGCELRILAETSQEKIWVDAFNAGWDVHSVGAEIIFGDRWKNGADEGCAYYHKNHQKCKCKVHKVLRDHIKAINFGIAYGMEAGKLARSLRITKKEAQDLLDSYRLAFPAVTAWLEKIGKEAQMNLCSRTLSGRRRVYAKPSWEAARKIAEERAVIDGKQVNSYSINRVYQAMYSGIAREGKNSPIQGTNADMIKLATGCGYDLEGVGYMWHRLESEFGAYLINIVHDECVVECPASSAVECLSYVKDCMKRAGAEFLKSVVAEAEGCFKNCWSKG